MKILRLILGDQLNEKHTWFNSKSEDITYVLMEIKSETNYVVHHIQKVVGIFFAMRLFAQKLKANGHQVVYIKLSDETNKHSFSENIQQLIINHKFQLFEYQLADEWRVDQEIIELTQKMVIETKAYDTEHFFTAREELNNLFEHKKEFIMETF